MTAAAHNVTITLLELIVGYIQYKAVLKECVGGF